MTSRRIASDLKARWIGAVIGEMLSKPQRSAAYFGDDAIEPRRWGQRILDERKVDSVRQHAFGENGALLIVYLPVAAVDKGQGRRHGIGGEKQIEPFARAVAVGRVEMPRALAPDRGPTPAPAAGAWC
jgi:hypothetical protein